MLLRGRNGADETDKWIQIGRIDVLSRELKSYTVDVVPIDQTLSEGDATSIQTELNTLYNQYGINWTVQLESKFASENKAAIEEIVGPDYQLTAGDEFLREYTAEQIGIHSLYKKYTGYDNHDPVVFLYANAPTEIVDANLKKGEMPIGRQWGYLYGGVDAPTLAHELAHSKFALEHTFAGSHCGSANQGLTDPDNLMDYPIGNNLVQVQWQYIHNTSLIPDIFQDDDDAMIVGTIMTSSGVLKGYALKDDEAYLTPSGIGVKILNIAYGAFSGDGQLLWFKLNSLCTKTFKLQ